MYDVNSYAVNSHAWFFREGDAYTLPAPGGNASALILPDPDDAGWIHMGDIEQWEDNFAQDEEKEVWKPKKGTLVRKKIITTKQALDFKLTTNDITRLAIEAFYRTNTKLSDEDR